MQLWGVLRVPPGPDLDIEVGVPGQYVFEINSGVGTICQLQNTIDLRKLTCLCSISGPSARPLQFGEVSISRNIQMIQEKFLSLRFGLHLNFKHSSGALMVDSAAYISVHWVVLAENLHDCRQTF